MDVSRWQSGGSGVLAVEEVDRWHGGHRKKRPLRPQTCVGRVRINVGEYPCNVSRCGTEGCFGDVSRGGWNVRNSRLLCFFSITDIPLEFHVLESGSVHGLAFWFDVAFGGSVQTVWLSTAPTEPLTHWYQVRCLLESPIFVKTGQVLKGSVVLLANKRQSYDVTIDLFVEGTNTRSTNTLDLKNPYFRYSGQAAAPPPGMNYSSPSEAYWNQLDAHGARQGELETEYFIYSPSTMYVNSPDDKTHNDLCCDS
uniref:type I protein arginine methyltransferase n=1 Tax=Timema monikensis TaxID=170555 RepID=A0A7R9E5Y4_9NEOP|nr:unnamed protein product [Timema monikensis]